MQRKIKAYHADLLIQVSLKSFQKYPSTHRIRVIIFQKCFLSVFDKSFRYHNVKIRPNLAKSGFCSMKKTWGITLPRRNFLQGSYMIRVIVTQKTETLFFVLRTRPNMTKPFFVALCTLRTTKLPHRCILHPHLKLQTSFKQRLHSCEMVK